MTPSSTSRPGVGHPITEREMLDVRTPREWEQWLERNHDGAPEVWLRLFSKTAAQPGIRYREAVEIALCFGWIDSLARRYDAESRLQRFSRRKPRSAWSRSNVERVQRLIDAGRMREAGQRHIDAAKADGRWPTH